MNRVVYYIFLLILTSLVCAFMFLSSFSFADPWETIVRTEENKWYTATLSGTKSSPGVNYMSINERTKKITPNTVVFWEVWRLSSLMYLAHTGTAFPPIMQSGSTELILSDMEGILSLYDLFSTYTISSKSGEFRLDEITNGSFYIWKESDGKIAIYAIDGVIRLAFLDKWVEMTSMILFPGSYIRFDPARNASLKWADLFRTILSLQEWENEVFEFVNPRVNTGDDKDTFFNYRLPLETRMLFQILSARFHSQVEGVDLLKSYSSDGWFQAVQYSEWVMNPSKRNHLMLLELKGLLSQLVRGKKSTASVVRRVGEIYNSAKSLKIEWSTAKKTIEQFLLDGRFALYGDLNNIGLWYQENYEAIARIIGITPTSGKSRLLQNLADIYSGNLFLQMSKTNTIRIDTYEPTATTLLNTVQINNTQTGWVDEKDLFDITLYVYNILDKVQDKWILSQDLIENKSTYDYLATFFYASSKYMSSIEDTEKKYKTITSFSSQFYERILSMLVRSLYSAFFRDDQWALYLTEKFADDKSVKITPDELRSINKLNSRVNYVNETIKNTYEWSDKDIDVYKKIQKATLRLDALAILLDPEKRNENYKEYINHPYATSTDEGFILPKVKDDLSGIELYIKPPEEIPVNPGNSLKNKKLENARALFPDANISVFVPEGDALRVNQAPWKILKTDGSVVDSFWSLVFVDEDALSQVIFSYAWRTIEVKFSDQTVTADTIRTLFRSTLKQYIDIIDSNSDIPGNIRIFISLKKIDIGDHSFSL